MEGSGEGTGEEEGGRGGGYKRLLLVVDQLCISSCDHVMPSQPARTTSAYSSSPPPLPTAWPLYPCQRQCPCHGQIYENWKCNFTMSPRVHPSVGWMGVWWLVDWSVCLRLVFICIIVLCKKQGLYYPSVCHVGKS